MSLWQTSLLIHNILSCRYRKVFIVLLNSVLHAAITNRSQMKSMGIFPNAQSLLSLIPCFIFVVYQLLSTSSVPYSFNTI